LVNSNISSTRPHNTVNVGPRLRSVGDGAPQLISTGFASWFRYCTNVAQRRSTKLCTMFGCLLGWYSIYTFWGLLFPNGILPGAKLTLRPSLIYWQRYCTNSSFAAWDKEIQQGGHHVVLPFHIINFSYYLDRRMAKEV